MGRRAAALLAVAALGVLALAGPVGADPGSDLDQANQNVDQANQQVQGSQQQLEDAEARLNDLIAQILDQSAAVTKLEARATDLAEKMPDTCHPPRAPLRKPFPPRTSGSS